MIHKDAKNSTYSPVGLQVAILKVDHEVLTFVDLHPHRLQEKVPGLSKPTLAKAKASYGWCSDVYGIWYMELRSGAM